MQGRHNELHNQRNLSYAVDKLLFARRNHDELTDKTHENLRPSGPPLTRAVPDPMIRPVPNKPPS